MENIAVFASLMEIFFQIKAFYTTRKDFFSKSAVPIMSTYSHAIIIVMA